MARQYFLNHPIIEYRGLKLRNLLLSARAVKGVLSKTTLIYPYTLSDGDTPQMIAYDYYGSVDYVWLVLLSNEMVDMYSDWYKSDDQLNEYIKKKYGSLDAAFATIHHYTNRSDLSATEVSVTTYQHATPLEQGQLDPVYAYDFEVAQNESKRTINLIDKAAAAKISLELERLLKA